MAECADQLIEQSEYGFSYFRPLTHKQCKRRLYAFLKQFDKSGITNDYIMASFVDNDRKLAVILKQYTSDMHWSKRSCKSFRQVINTIGDGANLESFKQWYLKTL